MLSTHLADQFERGGKLSTSLRRSPLIAVVCAAAVGGGSWLLLLGIKSALRRCSHESDDEKEDLFVSTDGLKLFSSGDCSGRRRPGSALLKGSPEEYGAGHAHLQSDIWTECIVERTEALHLVRAMLRGVEGVEFDSSEDKTESDETDVSLNYHIATELEASARDDLIQALQNNFPDTEPGERPPLDDSGESEQMLDARGIALTLVKVAEYLDISNERDKLRVRRDNNNLDCDVANHKGATGRRDTAITTEIGATSRNNAGARSWPPEIDRRLQEVATGGEEEQWEEEWEDETTDEENAAFMEYLQQDDSARQFYSREEIANLRRSRRRMQNGDPSDVMVLAKDGRAFDDYMDDLSPSHEDPGEDLDEELWLDEDSDTPKPWNDEEKRAFEVDLLARVHAVASEWGVTSAMAQRLKDQEDEDRRLSRAQGGAGHSPVRGTAAGELAEGAEQWEDISDGEGPSVPRDQRRAGKRRGRKGTGH